MVLDSYSDIAIDLRHKGPVTFWFFFLPHLIGHNQQNLIKLREGELEMLNE